MTPKEKALNLIELFCTEVEDIEYRCPKMNYNQAKQCALIAVDEIIKSWGEDGNDKFDNGIVNWWQQVKIEIKKI